MFCSLYMCMKLMLSTSEHSTNGIYQSHYLQEMKQNDINIFFL